MREAKNPVIISHAPPYMILDKVGAPGIPKKWRGKRAGSRILAIAIKKYQPKYVFCGHIHEAKGKKKVGKTLVVNAGSHGSYYIFDLK